ncbi:MAG TPA: ATP-binding protein [Anaeromyxobacteraceae bacterium]|nr:ATP-binding protein [Anaeromyxobacteraceae bacterium]
MRSLSIRTQLLGLALAVGLPLAALHAYDLVRVDAAAHAAARAGGLAVARAVARTLQQQLDRRRARADALAARPLVQALDSLRCDPMLAAVLEADPTVANVATFDAGGGLVCSARPVHPGSGRLLERGEPGRPASWDGTGVTDVLESPVLGRAVAAVDAPVRGSVTSGTGSLRIELELPPLADFLEGFDLPSGAEMAVLDRFGKVVGGTGRARAWLGMVHPEPALRAVPGGRRSGLEEDAPGLFLASADVPGTSWRVLVALPSEPVHAETHAGLWRDAVVLTLVVALVLALAIAISRRITAPVGAMERQLRLMERGLAGASFPVVLVRPDGTLAYANEAAGRAHRATRTELLRTRLFEWDLDHPEEQWADTWARIREAGSIRLQTHRRRLDGTTFPVEIHVQHLVFEGEEYAFAFLRDLTERAHAEEALRRTQEQFLQAQKMEAVGRLAGGVAHDFSNLLTVILSCAQSLGESLPPGDPRRTSAEDIMRAGRGAADLTRQLLAFSRRQPIAPRVLRLGDLVAGTEKMLRRLIGEDVGLALAGASSPWRVRVDPGQMEQVLLNLAVNARDAMPSGGRLAIEVSRRQLAGSLVDGGATVPPGRWVVLEVADTGSGMDEDVRRHAFEPFFSTKPQGQGTGLGLATVYGIVRRVSGHIALDSAPGSGTTFRIYLPEADEEAVPVRATPPPLRAVPAGSPGATILVVEDDGPLRAILTRALSGAGYRALSAASGREAIDLADSHLDPIDLLLTDVVMPGMNGRQLAERLAAGHPSMPVLYLSGYTDDILGPQGVLAPGVELLHKPFTTAELLEVVGRRIGAAGRLSA